MERTTISVDGPQQTEQLCVGPHLSVGRELEKLAPALKRMSSSPPPRGS
jgi:hypothetical protein